METIKMTLKMTTPTVTLSGKVRHGSPVPQIDVRFPKGTHYRAVKATCYKIAAEIEMATPAGEKWSVQIDAYNETGRVYLELDGSTPAEAERGMTLLAKILDLPSMR
jgi:hypothetical protein